MYRGNLILSNNSYFIIITIKIITKITVQTIKKHMFFNIKTPKNAKKQQKNTPKEKKSKKR
jgi:hypothetical protein